MVPHHLILSNMIKVTVLNNLEPIDLGSPHGLDKNELFERKIYLFGIRIWHYRYNRALDVKSYNNRFTPNKPGFK